MSVRLWECLGLGLLSLALGCEASDRVDDSADDGAEGGDTSADAGMDPTASDTAGDTGGGAHRACDEIEADYYAVIEASQACSSSDECSVIEGHCGLEGIGDCWHVVGESFVPADLEALVREWGEAPCQVILCACTTEPGVECSAGRCTAI